MRGTPFGVLRKGDLRPAEFAIQHCALPSAMLLPPSQKPFHAARRSMRSYPSQLHSCQSCSLTQLYASHTSKLRCRAVQTTEEEPECLLCNRKMPSTTISRSNESNRLQLLPTLQTIKA